MSLSSTTSTVRKTSGSVSKVGTAAGSPGSLGGSWDDDLLVVEVELPELGARGFPRLRRDRRLEQAPALDQRVPGTAFAGHAQDAAPRLALHVLEERLHRPLRPHPGTLGQALEDALDLLEQQVPR